jgi:hypothetical protein
MLTHDVRVKWAPGYTGIEGNEAADKLADIGATQPYDTGLALQPTVSGIRSIFRILRREVQCTWWAKYSTKLSAQYKKWGLDYSVKPLKELELLRSILYCLLAIRSIYRDFAWHYRKFKYKDILLTCSCGQDKDPEYLVRCRKATKKFV